jgi:hypothetical protein
MFEVEKKTTVEDKIRTAFSGTPVGTLLSARQIIFKVTSAFPEVGKNSVLPADRCYNITNAGLAYDYSFRIFEYLEQARYRYLGENYSYDGKVTWKGEPCGSWTKGVLTKGNNWPCRK